MANPTLVTCNEGQWTKVATAVVTGWLRKPKAAMSFNFYWTSRDTGGTAPSNSDDTDGGLAMPLFERTNNEQISSVTQQDFYVWVENADDDTADSTVIRVDL